MRQPKNASRAVIKPGGELVEGGLVRKSQVPGAREVLAQKVFVFSSVPRCHALLGPQK